MNTQQVLQGSKRLGIPAFLFPAIDTADRSPADTCLFGDLSLVQPKGDQFVDESLHFHDSILQFPEVEVLNGDLHIRKGMFHNRSMNPKDIARRAKALLEANGDRPIDFHNKNGMAVSSLSRILNAEFKRFPTEQLEKIAKFYGRDISYFTDQNNLVETTLSDTAQGVLAALEQADKNGSLTPSIASSIAQMLRSLTPIAPVDQPLPNEAIDAPRIDQVPPDIMAEDESFLEQQIIQKPSKKSA